MWQLRELVALDELPDCSVKRLTLDSRQVTNGDLFVALIGHQVDGRQFISQAIVQGAVAILSQTEEPIEDWSWDIIDNTPIVYVHKLDQKLSAIAGKFYAQPSEKLHLIGVTGTNGKTTIAQILAQWLELLEHTTAVMGTIGNGLYNQLVNSTNTTGSALEIQKNLADFYRQGAEYTVMEVSSHGLTQGRVEDLNFETVIFTNLSRDHLDYHKTMQHYAAAKKRLFNELAVQHKVINADDPVGEQWLAEMKDAIAVSCRADFLSEHTFLHATNITYHQTGATIAFTSSWGDGELKSGLIGPFNVSNVLLALATLLSLDFPLEKLTATAPCLSGVCGRMETFTAPNHPTVIVDYAHTPDALQKALDAARLHCQGKLWCLFGCGGDRDSGKRPLMGRIAEQFADEVVLTDDNPRTEDPYQIIEQVVSGFRHAEKATVIHGRDIALQYVMTHAKPQDIVLIAGKGHEDYQILGDKKIHFSDREIVTELLGNFSL